jgi:hypothetical protein
MRFPKENKVKVQKMPHCLTKLIKETKSFTFIIKKPGHFVRIFLKKKSDEKEKANQACEDQEQMFVATLGANDHTTYDWIIDSDATQHMTFEQEWFISYKSIVPQKVYMGDDTILEAIGKGNIKATIRVGGKLLLTTITQVVATLALGSRPRQKGLQGCGPKGSLGVTSKTPGSAGECEGVSHHTPKATPTLGEGVPMDSRNFREPFEGLKLNGLWRSLYHGKALGT